MDPFIAEKLVRFRNADLRAEVEQRRLRAALTRQRFAALGRLRIAAFGLLSRIAHNSALRGSKLAIDRQQHG